MGLSEAALGIADGRVRALQGRSLLTRKSLPPNERRRELPRFERQIIAVRRRWSLPSLAMTFRELLTIPKISCELDCPKNVLEAATKDLNEIGDTGWQRWLL